MSTETDMFFVPGSNLTLFSWVCRKLLVFSVSMEIDLVFVIIEIDLISVWGIELDWISAWGYIWFGCLGGRN